MKPDQAPDWGSLIDDLVGTGLSQRGIADAMGLTQMTESILRSYREGVQPMWWRGDGLVRLWCDVMKRERSDIPMIPVTRGRRRGVRIVESRTADNGPRLVNLPQWPPAPKAQPKMKQRKVAA
jgi:hypothetical protein